MALRAFHTKGNSTKAGIRKRVSAMSAGVKSELENTRLTLEENQKELVSIKGGLMDSEEKVKKYQDQLYLVTTNREYDALTNEIETVKSEMSTNEARKRTLFFNAND